MLKPVAVESPIQIRVSSNGKKITIDDNPANGFDVNTTFEIVSERQVLSRWSEYRG
ncbi:MAG: hypothetical protein CM15mV24_0230 [Bellamyvirus sp.]|nr:MAG: hypothetical protein CM15mV24_0230 [Bellamyvirus sp.]